jgi:hypothetical protein
MTSASPTPPPKEAAGKPAPPAGNAAQSPEDLGPSNRVQWFGRPDPGEKPIGLMRLLGILLSGHVGVRTRAQREEDFRRANGLHVFIGAIAYFVLIVSGLIVLVNVVSG